MQTFLPYRSFDRSAQCLDRARLGKQRVETLQIAKALLGHSRAWINHPATQMWKGFEGSLIQYGFAICSEWQKRGYRDTCNQKLSELAEPLSGSQFNSPPWMNDERLFASHRSNLLRKDSVWYGQFGWTESPDLPYFWPTKEANYLLK